MPLYLVDRAYHYSDFLYAFSLTLLLNGDTVACCSFLPAADGMSLNNIGSTPAGAPVAAQVWQNYTLDDVSPVLTYQGFTQNPQGGAGPFESARLYGQSVSYTSSAQASASFQFKGEL